MNSLNDLVTTMTKAVEAVRTGEVNADDLIKNIAETKKKEMLSTSPEYQVMNDTDKLECLVKDAENCSPSALILSKDISKEDRSSYDKSLCEIIYGDNDDTLFENVKNLVSKKFMPDFNNLLDILNDLGYNSYWQVLNAKDCGIPQNRERVFVISIRKDIDNGTFAFPKPFDNGLRLDDVLQNEDEIEDKYYLSDYIQK